MVYPGGRRFADLPARKVPLPSLDLEISWFQQQWFDWVDSAKINRMAERWLFLNLISKQGKKDPNETSVARINQHIVHICKFWLTFVDSTIFENELLNELKPLTFCSLLEVTEKRVISEEELITSIDSSCLLVTSDSTVAVVTISVFVSQFFLSE